MTTPFRRRAVCSLAEKGSKVKCDLTAPPSFFEPQIRYKRDDGLGLPHLLTYSSVAVLLGSCSIPALLEVALFLVPPDMS